MSEAFYGRPPTLDELMRRGDAAIQEFKVLVTQLRAEAIESKRRAAGQPWRLRFMTSKRSRDAVRAATS
jgi:hypothetical protein